MALSNIEHYLSYHLRILLPQVLSSNTSHRMAYVFALFAAITSGFVSLISLYAQPWQEHLSYTSWQINMIVTIINMGMYLTPPILGIVADAHGPITLSLTSIVGFVPSYAYLARTFNRDERLITEDDGSFTPTLISFFIIGVATSGLFFSALITCAKLFPNTKLLSISIPTTCYGLSSLIGSQFLRMKYFHPIDYPYLDLGRVFKAFAWIYAVIGIMVWIATSKVAMIEDDADRTEETEESRLLSENNSSHQHKNLWKVLSDPILYVFGMTIFLALGPLEMFIANMGSLTNVIAGHEPQLSSALLSVYAFTSTITRLTTGLITDYFNKKQISVKWILLFFLAIGLITQGKIYLLSVTSSGRHGDTREVSNDLFSVGIMQGIAYGGLFTIYPTLTLMVWGDKLFGTAYGTLMIAPALGSALSCMIYANIYDTKCASESAQGSCIAPVYESTALQFLIAIILTIIVTIAWRRRRIRL
ncbi:putative transporter MCH1 [Nakaseomyces bracarensis]|uniref:Probable transporter MCH1 n=1 Tax=Nakaseomyces bracarensis TaxID=273131 RepID=A0ABR4NNN8_9SACH